MTGEIILGDDVFPVAVVQVGIPAVRGDRGQPEVRFYFPSRLTEIR